MSILEILEAHRPTAEHYCGACPQWTPPDEDLDAVHSMNDVDWFMRAHLAQVLEQHEREAKAEAVEGTAKYLRKRFKRVDNPEHIFGANLAIMLIAEHAEEIRNPS